MKRVIAAVICVCMWLTCLCGCGGKASEHTAAERPVFENETPCSDLSGAEFIQCGESGDLKLSFQPATTHFRVENAADGSVWHSNPQNAEEDGYATKLTQMQMMSTLAVEYTNVETKKTTSLNLYTASVRSGKYTVTLVDNGVCFKYEVSEIGKYVYLSVTLKDGFLNTDVWYESTGEEKENVYVSAISVTPYFVSGSLGDEGYLFIPDGSGALVSYNTDNITADSYSRPIYGEEPTGVTADYYLQASQTAVCMPVFGAVRGNSAVMAVVTSGAETGTLKANACGQQSSYANVYASYSFLNSIEYDLGTYSTVVYDKKATDFDTVTTRYYFLSGDDASYSGMARRYREHLKEEYSLKESPVENTFYADVYGGVYRKVSTLGIPHDKFVPLTTADELARMTGWLRDNGVNGIAARYRSWNTDELLGNRVDSAAVSGKLDFDELSKITEAEIYPAVLNVQTYSNGGFFDALANATYSVTGLPFSMNGYLKSNLQATDETVYWIAAGKLHKNVNGLLEKLAKKGFDKIALGDIGSSLYCDFRDDGQRRSDSKRIMTAILKRAEESFASVMLESANDYAAVYADVIFNAPVDHSGQDILEQSVPFYSMALSSLVSCVAPAYNGENAADGVLLSAAAFGTAVSCSWMSGEASELLSTELRSLTNINFETTRDEALEQYRKLSAVYEAAAGSPVYSHEYITDTLSLTKYENGAEVYVNLGESETAVGEVTVPAQSFIVIGGK